MLNILQGVCLKVIFLSYWLHSLIFITMTQNMAHLDKNTHTFVIFDKNCDFCHENIWNFDFEKSAIFYHLPLIRAPGYCLVSFLTLWTWNFINSIQNFIHFTKKHVFWYKSFIMQHFATLGVIQGSVLGPLI